MDDLMSTSIIILLLVPSLLFPKGKVTEGGEFLYLLA